MVAGGGLEKLRVLDAQEIRIPPYIEIRIPPYIGNSDSILWNPHGWEIKLERKLINR
jgi:hypothetical protein